MSDYSESSDFILNLCDDLLHAVVTVGILDNDNRFVDDTFHKEKAFYPRLDVLQNMELSIYNKTWQSKYYMSPGALNKFVDVISPDVAVDACHSCCGSGGGYRNLRHHDNDYGDSLFER